MNRPDPSKYKIDPRTAFKDCKRHDWVEPNHGRSKLVKIQANESRCFYGSFLLSSNSSYTVTAALPEKVNKTYTWNYSEPMKNALAILAKYNESGEIDSQPVAKIQCTDNTTDCFIQILPVRPSFNLTRNVNVKGVNTTIKDVQQTIVSTKKSGSEKLIIRKKVKNTSKKSKLIENYVTVGFFGSDNVIEFNFNRQNGTGFVTSLGRNDRAQYPRNLTGTVGKSRSAFFYPVLNERELNNGTGPQPPKPDQNGTQPQPPRPEQNGTQPQPPRPEQNGTQLQPPRPGQNGTQPYQPGDDHHENQDDRRHDDDRDNDNGRERFAARHTDDDISREEKECDYNLSVEISYSVYQEKTASEDDDETTVWFFPEIYASLSANGGVFTQETINVETSETTTDSETSGTVTKKSKAGLIAGLVIAGVAAVVIGAILAVFIIRKKSKKDYSTEFETVGAESLV